jgi:hypothetical protein
MISNNEDLYKVIDNLCGKLLQSGEIEWSERLNNALYISNLPGEVLGELRSQLNSLQQIDVSEKLALKDSIREAIKYINKALRSKLL